MDKDRMFKEVYDMIYDIQGSSKRTENEIRFTSDTLGKFASSMTKYMSELMEMQMRQNELLTVQALGVRRSITKDPAEIAIIDAQITALTSKLMVNKENKELSTDFIR